MLSPRRVRLLGCGTCRRQVRLLSLLDGEIEFVKVDVIRGAIAVPVELIIDRHAIPTRGSGCLVVIQRRRLPIQSDRLVQQLIVRGSLDADDEMIPRTAQRIARDAGRNPLFIDIVIHIPLVPSSDPALVSPNEGMSSRELIDVEFQRLRDTGVLDPEVDVIGEIVKSGNQCMFVVRQPLRRERADNVVVPQHIPPLYRSATV